MSRLAGRITFPGEAPQENDSQPTSSAFPSDHERNNRNTRNFSDKKPRSNINSENPGKPRGKGNFRYHQGSQNSERSDRQPERPQRAEKPERNSQNSRNFQKSRENPDFHRESPRKPTERIENVMPSEELLELEDIIAQISDLSVRNDRSAAQIKRNILASNDLIHTMEEDDWEKVCSSMIQTALEQGEPEFISDLIVALFKNDLFSAVMSDELMAISSKHIMETEDENLVPSLLSAILCAHWPRQYAKAFDNINPILYTVVCIVKGWILVVNEDTENYYKEEKRPKYPVREEEELNETEPENAEKTPETEEKTVENPEIVNKCALALSELCDTAQRQLWVNWMSVTDEIYQCFKPAITHNPNIRGTVKARILDTFIQMNQWTKNREASVKHKAIQTVPENI